MQDREPFLHAVLRFLRKVLLAVLVGLVVAALIWLAAGWRTAASYGEACQWAGILYLIAGGGSVIGMFGTTRSFSYQYSASAGMSISERLNQSMNEFAATYGFLFLMLISGPILLLLGGIIQVFFISAP